MIADAVELNQICLKQSDAKWKVDAHDPEFRRAQKVAIGGIRQNNLDQIEVETEHAEDSDGYISYFDVWQISIHNEPDDTRAEYHRPSHDEPGVCLCECIPIHNWAYRPRSAMAENSSTCYSPQFLPRGSRPMMKEFGGIGKWYGTVDLSPNRWRGCLDPYALLPITITRGKRTEASFRFIACSRSRAELRVVVR